MLPHGPKPWNQCCWVSKDSGRRAASSCALPEGVHCHAVHLCTKHRQHAWTSPRKLRPPSPHPDPTCVQRSLPFFPSKPSPAARTHRLRSTEVPSVHRAPPRARRQHAWACPGLPRGRWAPGHAPPLSFSTALTARQHTLSWRGACSPGAATLPLSLFMLASDASPMNEIFFPTSLLARCCCAQRSCAEPAASATSLPQKAPAANLGMNPPLGFSIAAPSPGF